MKMKRSKIALYIFSSLFELLIMVYTFLENNYLPLFSVIKIFILLLNSFLMTLFFFSRTKKDEEVFWKKNTIFFLDYRKYLMVLIFLISEFIIFGIEFIIVHEKKNPFLSLLRVTEFFSKLLILKTLFINKKKFIVIIFFSVLCAILLTILSMSFNYDSQDIIAIILNYSLLLFNLFFPQMFNVKLDIYHKKIKLFSSALFEEFYLKNGKPIFIIKKSSKVFSLEMMNQKAEPIFGLENGAESITFNILNERFQYKFAGIPETMSRSTSSIKSVVKIKKEENQKLSMDSVKVNITENNLLLNNIGNTIEEDILQTKLKLDLPSIINSFQQGQRNKKLDIFFKNTSNEGLEHYQFEIIKRKCTKKTYFIFLIHDQSKKDEIKNLKHLNEYNNRLFCSLSHELKTPINGALPNLEILRGSLKDEDLLNLLDISLGSLKLLENSINNIMDYYLLQTNQILVNKRDLVLSDFISEILGIINPMITMKKLDLNIEASEDVERMTIKTDYIKLRQILLNLLTNAIQFTFSGEINLRINMIEDKKFVFFVEDTGIGIEDQKLKNILKKIKESDQENLEINSTGSCMGLIICEELSSLLGSENGLSIESKVNEGSKFSFTLISDIKHMDDENSNKYTSSIAITSKSKSSKTINIKTNSLLKHSSLLEEKRQSNLNEQRLKKETIAFDDPESLVMKSVKSGTSPSTFMNIDERLRMRYDFQNLVKLMEDVAKGSPKSEQDNSLSIDSSLKPVIYENYSHLSLQSNSQMNYLNKDFLKFSSILFPSPNIISSSKKDCVQSENPSLVINGRSKRFSFDRILKRMKCECEEILYCDDDAFNLLSLELILKSLNLKCCKVMNGAEAIKELKKKKCENNNCPRFKLILMDYQMPIMDGIETTKKIIEMIKKNEIPETTIIGCTAFVSKDEITKCYEVGMKDVIFKPISKNLIKNIINEWLI